MTYQNLSLAKTSPFYGHFYITFCLFMSNSGIIPGNSLPNIVGLELPRRTFSLILRNPASCPFASVEDPPLLSRPSNLLPPPVQPDTKQSVEASRTFYTERSSVARTRLVRHKGTNGIFPPTTVHLKADHEREGETLN